MAYDRTLFKELKPTKATKIKVGDGRYISAKGKGILQLQQIQVQKQFQMFFMYLKLIKNFECSPVT